MAMPDHRLFTLADADAEVIGTDDPSRSRAIVLGSQAYHPRQVVAGALVIAGLLAIAIGWFGAGGNNDVWEQIPFLISGGIGGAALVALGIVTYMSYEHIEDRRCIATLVDRLDELELGLAGEFDALSADVRDVAAASRRSARRTTPA